ncbi:MAG: flippase-like domain-containing protein [Candidatus Diapherotrites archaeon]|nr:flippase-like domain-containing protein [Candidatus Diapherotrites archaeon]
MDWKALASTIAFGLLVMTAIVYALGPENILIQVMRLDPDMLALALALEVISVLVLAARWHYIISASKNDAQFIKVLGINLAGSALNAATPLARSGGEPLKAYLLKKRCGIRASVGVATLVAEKMADMIAFCLIAVAALVYSVYVFNQPTYVFILILASFVFTLSLVASLWYVSYGRRVRSRSVKAFLERHENLTGHIPILSHFKSDMSRMLKAYYKTLTTIAKHKHVWIYSTAFSLAFWGIEILRAYVLFRALGTDPALTAVAAALVISSLVGHVPLPLPGSLGAIEGSMIAVYSSAGIALPIAGVVTVMDRLLSYWLVIATGLPMAWFMGVSKRK